MKITKRLLYKNNLYISGMDRKTLKIFIKKYREKTFYVTGIFSEFPDQYCFYLLNKDSEIICRFYDYHNTTALKEIKRFVAIRLNRKCIF